MTSSKTCCRLCSRNISANDEFINIFDDASNVAHNNTLAIIVQHYGIEVHVDDDYSNSICMVCWSVTDNFHKLYELVKRTEISLSGTYVGDDHRNECSEDEKNEIVLEDKARVEDSSVNIKEELAEDDSRDSPPGSPVSDHNPIRAKNLNPQNVDDHDRKERREKYEQENQQIRDFFSMKCELCDIQFRTVNEALVHYKKIHNKVGYLTCCSRKFQRRCQALDHIQQHMNPSDLSCKICGKAYSGLYVLRRHMLIHKAVPEPTEFTCSICSKKFVNKMLLSHHIRRSHLSSEEKKFGCDICGKFFTTKRGLKTHIQGVHENAFAQMCHICAKTFRTKQIYKLHLRQHSETEAPKLQCNICGQWLKHETGLQRHLALHAETEVSCSICHKVSPNKRALRVHMQYVHSEAKFKCTICEKSFKKPIELKEHMASHTGVDLYACPYCAKTFKSSANMYSHRKKEHFHLWTEHRRQND